MIVYGWWFAYGVFAIFCFMAVVLLCFPWSVLFAEKEVLSTSLGLSKCPFRFLHPS